MGSVVNDVSNFIHQPDSWAVGQVFGSKAKDDYMTNVNESHDPLELFGPADGGSSAASDSAAVSAFDKNGRPIMPEWQSAADPSSQANGGLQSVYTLGTPTPVSVDTTSMNAMKGIADGSFIQDQLDANKLNTQNQLDQNARGSQSAYQNVMSQMAQNGGLSGAARERALINSNNNAFANQMGILRQDAKSNLDIQNNGKLKQFDMLNSLQNQSNQQANLAVQNQQMSQDANKFNIANALSELGNKRNFDINKYQADLNQYNNEKQADIQGQYYANQKKGGLLGGLF